MTSFPLNYVLCIDALLNPPLQINLLISRTCTAEPPIYMNKKHLFQQDRIELYLKISHEAKRSHADGGMMGQKDIWHGRMCLQRLNVCRLLATFWEFEDLRNPHPFSDFETSKIPSFLQLHSPSLSSDRPHLSADSPDASNQILKLICSSSWLVFSVISEQC